MVIYFIVCVGIWVFVFVCCDVMCVFRVFVWSVYNLCGCVSVCLCVVACIFLLLWVVFWSVLNVCI